MKIFLDTVGCRLNQAEIEIMAGQFRTAGHEIVAGAEEADLAVVNTCAVTTAAASDSRSMIRRAARLGADRIVVTGCWASLEPQAAAGLPRVSNVVSNQRKDDLVPDVLALDRPAFEAEPLARAPLPGLRRRTRAFIKVQDGCDHHCTFCITTVARGRSRSRPIADVCGDIEAALAGGALEIVLTGVHLGAWGKDLGMDLRQLVQSVLRQTDVPRLRLSSLEPWDLDREFFGLWEDPRLCPHLHLPLQSGCAATLRRMARRTTPRSFRLLVEDARDVIPDVAITTDVIAGFPGESEAEFEDSLAFVREMEFAGGHAFTYSPRPGTAAARRLDQIGAPVRRRRTRQYLELFSEAGRRYRQPLVGRTKPVLWESFVPRQAGEWELAGLTDNYVRVRAVSREPRWNDFSNVRIAGMAGSFLEGIIVK
jgi:threonylcarbamoyladenosine tRNA methylthiotransferase MtaB